MLVDDLSQQEENFWPSMTQTADGRILLVTGGNGGSLISVEGLEAIRRLPDQTIDVSPEQLREAEGWRIAQEQTRQREQGDERLTVRMLTEAPAVDGKLDEWPGEGFVQIDERASAALAVAGDRLYAAFRTGEAGLLRNAGEALPLLFKSGGALDLMLESVPDSLRLLVAHVDGETAAVLYRPEDPAATGQPVPFSSPMRTITFDRVGDVSDQVTLAADGAGNYEFSVSLALLGLEAKVGETVRGDIGVLRGNGFRTLQRAYWRNKATGITSDVPSEAELRPELWGTVAFE